MTVVVLLPEPAAERTAACHALLAALRAGLGRIAVVHDTSAATAACSAAGRPVLVADLRAPAAPDAAAMAALRLALPSTALLALVAPGRPPPAECDAALVEPFYLDEVVRWCERARRAPLPEGALADLAAGLSHEIGNPLTALQLQLELLRDDPRAADVREHLDQLDELGRRIGLVIADVSRASERQPVSPAPGRLADLLSTARRHLLERDAAFAPRVELDCDDSPVHVEAPLVARALADTWEYLLRAGSGDEVLVVRAGRRADWSVRVQSSARVPRLPDDAGSRLFTPLWARQALGLPAGLSLTGARAAFRRHGGDLRVRDQRDDRLELEALLPLRGAP